MKKIILHIGTHKTGTTALQQALESNRTLFAKQKISVLVDDLAMNSVLLSNLSDNEKAWKLKELFLKWNKGRDLLIISWEGFSGELRNGYKNVGGIANLLAASLKGFDVRVIVYFRRQDEFIESAYAQMVHEGDTLSFSEYCDQLESNDFNWLRVANAYGKVFGRERILCGVYDQSLLKGTGLVADFFKKLEIVDYESGKDTARRVNKSLKGPALNLLRLCNKSLIGVDRHRLRMILQSSESKYPTKDVGLLSQNNRRRIFEMYVKSNRTLVDLFMAKNKGCHLLNQPLGDDEIEECDQSVSVDSLATILGRSIVELDNRAMEIAGNSRARTFFKKLKAKFLKH